jgi:hypothetical protein
MEGQYLKALMKQIASLNDKYKKWRLWIQVIVNRAINWLINLSRHPAGWIKTRYTKFLVIMKSSPSKIKLASLKQVHRLEHNVSHTYYGGVRLMDSRASIVGYLLLTMILWGVVLILDSNVHSQQFIHPISGNEMVIGIVATLFALFVPLAIALIEDADRDPLARQVIIKSILRAGFTPLLLLAIFFHLLMPQHWHISGNEITLKTLSAVPLLLAIVFIMFSFYRSYKWLVDGSISATGSDNTPDPNNPNTDSPVSYRFAQIIKTLANDNTSERWNMVWRKNFPLFYEDALHNALFTRLMKLTKNPNPKNMTFAVGETRAYYIGFNKRDITQFQFVDSYLEKFLRLYAQLQNIYPIDRSISVEVRNSAMNIERVVRQIIDKGVSKDEVWSVTHALYIYANEAWYFKSNPAFKVNMHDRIVPIYITAVLENLSMGVIDAYDIDSTNNETRNFTITVNKLSQPRAVLQVSILKAFDRWLDEKLNNIEKIAKPFAIAEAIEFIFPEADPATLSELIWFKHINGTNSDPDTAIDYFIKNERPFGYGSRVFGSDYVSEEQNLKQFTEFLDAQIDEAVHLFALFSRNYFSNVINIDALIERTSVSYEIMDKDVDLRIQRFNKHLKALKQYLP